ncbi:transcriptional regulator, MucR family [Candidatus Rhodobacter oscarellae]|uniref:Transcriptional regulator, MucR family n=2 Tax=Candidatus Rhodobacter oscarellae TaxID=1675527 RepID=A0A0J9EDM9_9RHOB|nr:MucR family transcriptional regulator [Candidatus Rhodobacter lobularis]KMW59839.1 transcriptional regulator, MucR family [Candidatus Rhodobacter lobularis]
MNEDLLGMTADIVAAYASHNQMAQSELTDLIASVHGTLTGLSSGATVGQDSAADAPLVPAVPIDASVTRDAIICLEDGKPYKTLKRHLRTAYDMSSDEYRERWGLSKDYPMVAPSYSERRAETAKKIGLGRKPGSGKTKK